MTPSRRDVQNAAALLVALGNLSVDAQLSEEVHGLADRLWTLDEREADFAIAVREWAVMLRSRFSPRTEGPAT